MSRIQRFPAHHSRYLQELDLPESAGAGIGAADPVRAWGSRDFLVVLYDDQDHDRLTINRTSRDSNTGRWVDGIAWDELMDMKDQAGFGDRWAVEIYPPELEVINDANMRHLWLLSEPPACGWHTSKENR